MRLAGRSRSGRKRAHRAAGSAKSGRRPTRAGTTPSRPSHVLRGDPSYRRSGPACRAVSACCFADLDNPSAWAHDREPPALAARVLPGQLGAVVLRQSVCRPVAAYRSQPEPELLLVIRGHDVDRPHPADPAAMRHANHATTAAGPPCRGRLSRPRSGTPSRRGPLGRRGSRSFESRPRQAPWGLERAISTRAMFEEHLGAADNAYPRRRGRGVHVNLVQSDALLSELV